MTSGRRKRRRGSLSLFPGRGYHRQPEATHTLLLLPGIIVRHIRIIRIRDVKISTDRENDCLQVVQCSASYLREVAYVLLTLKVRRKGIVVGHDRQQACFSMCPMPNCCGLAVWMARGRSHRSNRVCSLVWYTDGNPTL